MIIVIERGEKQLQMQTLEQGRTKSKRVGPSLLDVQTWNSGSAFNNGGRKLRDIPFRSASSAAEYMSQRKEVPRYWTA
jgi:hypothetical protein